MCPRFGVTDGKRFQLLPLNECPGKVKQKSTVGPSVQTVLSRSNFFENKGKVAWKCLVAQKFEQISISGFHIYFTSFRLFFNAFNIDTGLFKTSQLLLFDKGAHGINVRKVFPYSFFCLFCCNRHGLFHFVLCKFSYY